MDVDDWQSDVQEEHVLFVLELLLCLIQQRDRAKYNWNNVYASLDNAIDWQLHLKTNNDLNIENHI